MYFSHWTVHSFKREYMRPLRTVSSFMDVKESFLFSLHQSLEKKNYSHRPRVEILATLYMCPVTHFIAAVFRKTKRNQHDWQNFTENVWKSILTLWPGLSWFLTAGKRSWESHLASAMGRQAGMTRPRIYSRLFLANEATLQSLEIFYFKTRFSFALFLFRSTAVHNGAETASWSHSAPLRTFTTYKAPLT